MVDKQSVLVMSNNRKLKNKNLYKANAFPLSCTGLIFAFAECFLVIMRFRFYAGTLKCSGELYMETLINSSVR